MKVTRRLRLSTLGLIALVGTMVACEGGVEPAQILDPKPESEQVLLSWETGTGFTVVRETEERVGSVEALIGPPGRSTIFSGGASEYAINNTPCRLLDIQDLLSDTGMGREMHVIVGQGQLDAVLSAGPEERRGFIEAAVA